MLYLKNFSPVVDGRKLYPGIDLDLNPRDIISVMGHSGCGKTSLFRALKKQLASIGETVIPPEQIFSVFQDHDQLFPWFTVERNLDMVCERDWRELADRWKILDLIHHKPTQLSVGQKQRFTLLRGICSSRQILLCDEPLSAVDGITALTIIQDFADIIHEKAKICLWITHNITEAKLLSDQILVINSRSPKLLPNTSQNEKILSYF
jgi:ABC-type nitrate/sulfonate/bicarbonate transport system ATPase subunit